MAPSSGSRNSRPTPPPLPTSIPHGHRQKTSSLKASKPTRSTLTLSATSTWAVSCVPMSPSTVSPSPAITLTHGTVARRRPPETSSSSNLTPTATTSTISSAEALQPKRLSNASKLWATKSICSLGLSAWQTLTLASTTIRSLRPTLTAAFSSQNSTPTWVSIGPTISPRASAAARGTSTPSPRLATNSMWPARPSSGSPSATRPIPTAPLAMPASRGSSSLTPPMASPPHALSRQATKIVSTASMRALTATSTSPSAASLQPAPCGQAPACSTRLTPHLLRCLTKRNTAISQPARSRCSPAALTFTLCSVTAPRTST